MPYIKVEQKKSGGVRPNSGRTPLPDAEKRVRIVVYTKQKFEAKARAEIAKVLRKFEGK